MIPDAMRRPLLPLTLALTLLAGCGADAPAVAPRDNVVRVTVDEYRIVPQAFTVHRGVIELVAHNTGRLTHNVKVEIPAHSADDKAKVIAGTDTMHPGGTSIQIFRHLRPGRYRLVCTVGNHENLGQYGTLVVK
jgi:hypothetical protein